MLKGVSLTLLRHGDDVPVSRVVLDALTAVEVTSAAEGPSGFQLTFTLSNDLRCSASSWSAGTNPLLRVIIVVTIKARPDVLMDGVMTNHQVTPGSKPGESVSRSPART